MNYSIDFQIVAYLYIIGYPISLILLHKFHKNLGMDYNQPKTYVDYDDWDNNAQAFAAFSIAWPVFWILTLFMFLIKKVLSLSSFIEGEIQELNQEKPILSFNDKLKQDNKQLQDNLNKIRLENDELRKKLKL
jgi:hypothetical protein